MKIMKFQKKNLYLKMLSFNKNINYTDLILHVNCKIIVCTETQKLHYYQDFNLPGYKEIVK